MNFATLILAGLASFASLAIAIRTVYFQKDSTGGSASKDESIHDSVTN